MAPTLYRRTTTAALNALLAASLFSGCGGSLPQAADVPSSAMVATTRHVLPLVRKADGASWMLPEAKNDDLLYVGGFYQSSVDVFSYPQGTLVGSISGVSGAQGLCTDAHGDVFITNSNYYDIVEYAHAGTKPLETLEDPGYFSSDCAVDSRTGDMAVSNTLGINGSQGNLLIFKGAKGSPVTYSDAALYRMIDCAYDDKGSLFVGGANTPNQGGFQLAELASKGKALKNLRTNFGVVEPGGMAWDGHHMTVEDQYFDTIYPFVVSGQRAKYVRFTTLAQSADVVFYLFSKSGKSPSVVGADGGNGYVGIWQYPSGRRINLIEYGGFRGIEGVALSQEQRR